MAGASSPPPMPEAVAAAFAAFPAGLADRLREVRGLIFAVAAETPGVGPLTETLKWGEPAYLTEASGSGSTIRLGRMTGEGGGAVLFNCRTSLLDDFRARHAGELRLVGDRAIALPEGGDLPRGPLSACLRLALTYHVAVRGQRGGRHVRRAAT